MINEHVLPKIDFVSNLAQAFEIVKHQTSYINERLTMFSTQLDEFQEMHKHT